MDQYKQYAKNPDGNRRFLNRDRNRKNGFNNQDNPQRCEGGGDNRVRDHGKGLGHGKGQGGVNRNAQARSLGPRGRR